RGPQEKWLEGQGPEKPPEDPVGQAPTQTRSVSANVALKKQSERRSDDHGDDKVQRLSKSGRGGSHKGGDERKEMRFLHPLSEGPVADDAREPTSDERTCETEWLRSRPWGRLSHGQSTEHQTERRAKDEQIAN